MKVNQIISKLIKIPLIGATIAILGVLLNSLIFFIGSLIIATSVFVIFLYDFFINYTKK